jgi:cell division protein FtsQ
MWPFNRKRINRRVPRRHVLDVKFRSDVARAQYARRAATLFLSLFGTLLALFVFWRAGEWVLDQVLFRNNDFRVSKIEIQTDGVLATDQIRRWAGVAMGQNLLALDLSRIKSELERVPAIRSATLERALPSTLRLRITEREPLAEVQAPRTLPNGTVIVAVYHLDEDGCVLPPLDPRQRATPAPAAALEFPIIMGIEAGELVPGRRITAPAVRAALDLLIAFAESPMVGLDDLRRIELVSADILQVSTVFGAQVTFSTRDFPKQLRRWREIYDYGQQSQRHLAWVDLAVANNVPVRWLEANALPEAPPRLPTRPVNPRRRHV